MGSEQIEAGADWFGSDEATAWLEMGRILVAQGHLRYERQGDLHTVTVRTLPVTGSDAELLRQQGQAEGFAAAVQQLRDMGGQKPPLPLWHAASLLANSLEQSRIPYQALTGGQTNGE